MNISVDDLIGVFPRALTDEEKKRAEALIVQALTLIELEFARRGRDLPSELGSTSWLSLAVKHAVLIMVSQAVLVGENIGRASVSSTTGPQSDSISFSQGVGIHWGGVGITDEVLELLGLAFGSVPRGRGGVVVPFGQRRNLYGAEFSERGRC